MEDIITVLPTLDKDIVLSMTPLVQSFKKFKLSTFSRYKEAPAREEDI